MPGFSTEVPHELGQERATERLKSFLELIQERYQDQVSNLEGDWQDNVLTFALTTFGFTIKGTLTVEDSFVRLDGQLPFAALAFKGKIESSIAAELERALKSKGKKSGDDKSEGEEAGGE